MDLLGNVFPLYSHFTVVQIYCAILVKNWCQSPWFWAYRDFTRPRGPECLSLRPNWTPPVHSPAIECAHPLGTKGEEDNTRMRVRGRGQPILPTVEKAWHSVWSVVLSHHKIIQYFRGNVILTINRYLFEPNKRKVWSFASRSRWDILFIDHFVIDLSKNKTFSYDRPSK